MEFTGERFVPGAGSSELFHEHVHRYRLATRLAPGRRVLDVGSGEGFGAAMLGAADAADCIGIDVDPAAVAHAQAKYGNGGPAFKVAHAQTTAFPDASFDLVTCFEVVEHIDDPAAVAREIARVLTPGGTALISTPEKTAYNALTGAPNPFHVAEMTHEEFATLLGDVFPVVTMLEQRSLVASWIGPFGRGLDGAAVSIEHGAHPTDATFLVAICGDTALDLDASIFLNGSQQATPERLELARQTSRARDQLATYEREIQAIAEALHNADAEIQRLQGLLGG